MLTRHSTFRTALLLPSVTRRIDEFLLVKELNAKLLNHAVLEKDLHAAISPPSANIEYDYERLEMLGLLLEMVLPHILIL